MHSVLGDADLFVSLTNPAPDIEDHRWSSRRKSEIDQVTIEEKGGENLLNRPIYFSVFGSTAAQVQIFFEYEFKLSYEAKLDDARDMGDGERVHE